MLSRNLRTFRTQCSLSQLQVANALGIDRSTYSCYEIGKTQPHPNVLLRLAHLFNVSVDELLSEMGDRMRNSTENYYPVNQSVAMSQLKKSEQDLILLFRQLDASDQLEMVNHAKTLLEQSLEK